MSGSLSIEDRLIRIRFTDGFTVADLMEMGDKLRELENRQEVSLNRLTDLSEVDDSQVDYNGMESFARRRRRASLKNDVRSAIVAPRPILFGMARMFQMLNDHPRIWIQVFRNMEDAMAWLEEPNGQGDGVPGREI